MASTVEGIWVGRRRRSSGLIGMLAFALVAANPANAEIKIGFQAPLTGFAATDGKSAKIAAEHGDRGNQCRWR